MTEKDYSLMRPFDLEKAKAGEAICYAYDGASREFISARDGEIVIHDSNGFQINATPYVSYRMAPLAWVEGKPIYKDDVLYWVCENVKVTVGNYRDDESIYGTNGCFYTLRNLTWTPPKKTRKVKLLGWLSPKGQLHILTEGAEIWPHKKPGWSRVPSEDRTVIVEE